MVLGAGQRAVAVDHLDLEPLRGALDLPHELVDDTFLAGAKRGDVDGGGRGDQSVVSGMPRVAHDVRGAKNRLGRDTAPVQARSAQPLAFDERHFRAEPGRLERRRVAAGTSTKYCDTHRVSSEP